MQAFRVHLQPWEKADKLEIWRDKDKVKPGQRWDDEIKQALTEIDAAVLFLSPDFFATDYIWDVELPALVKAREEGRIQLSWLHLRHCNVDHADRAIEIALDGEAAKSIKLTVYQGLHDKNIVIADPSTQRDAVYAKAAANLMALLSEPAPERSAWLTAGRQSSRPKPARAPGNTVYELTIRLTLRGSQLSREFFHPYGRIPVNSPPWPMQAGINAFEILFGSQETCDAVLGTLWGIDLAPPVRHPVRVRIQANAPRLTDIPWMSAAWEDHLLISYGWTFELIRETAFDATPTYPDVTLNTPCSVLVIAPTQTPDADAHVRDLQERLDHAWPVYHEPPHRVRDWDSLQRTWRQRRPRLVYY